MDFKPDFMGYNFTWFIGEVEAREDPLKVGRVKVRCFGWHSENKEELPTADLPWAQTIQPVTAPAAAPTGLTIGVWVFGFFMDGEKAQRPMIMGQIPGYRYNADGTGESELPRAARAEANLISSQSELRKQSRITGVLLGASAGSTWDEPEEPDDKKYPYVQTVGSESGFITETIFGPYDMDPVTGLGSYEFKTRQVTYDCSGGYEERKSPSGDKITKVIGDNYEIVCGSNFVNIKGDVNLTVDGSMRTNIAGDYELNVAGNMYTTVGKSDDKFILGSQTIGITGSRDTYIAGVGLDGGIGDKKVVALGGVLDILAAGKREIQTGGAFLHTVAGSHTETTLGVRTITVTGLLTVEAASHLVTLGTGSFTTTGTLTAGTVISTVPYPVTLGTHKHATAAVGPPSVPTPV